MITKEKFKVINVNGYEMYIFLGEKGISKELYLYKQREKFATAFMKSFIKNDDIILEIGANIGYYALLENKIAEKGKIFAFEPMIFNRTLLEKNVKLNNIKNIEIYPFALGDLNKTQEFYVYDKINWSSFNKNLRGKIVSTYNVKVITVDNFVKEYLNNSCPTVLRMDVEGYEYEVIIGAINTLKRSTYLKVFMEIHPQLLSPEKLNKLINIFEDNNFKITAIINECQPHLYPYLNDKIWNSTDSIPYGYIGNNYEDLKKYLEIGKGTEVFFEKNL